MAARKTGLGRGIDGLFPSYNYTETDEAKENNTPKKSNASRSTAKRTKQQGAEKSAGRPQKKSSEGKPTNDNTQEDKEDHVRILKITQVEPNREQPRKVFNEDALQELSESIRQFGVIQPLLVQKRDDYYEIIAGERRWRAAKLAGLKEIPVIIRDYSEREIVEISLIENIQREDLNPIEEARAYQRLLEEFTLKQDEVAERVAKSRSTITNALRLLRLDERVQQMLIDESLSAGHARALLAIEEPALQFEIAQKVFDQHLSVRDVEKLVRKLQREQKETQPDQKTTQKEIALNLIYQEMENHLKEVLGTKVVVHRRSEKRGRIEIEYYSNDELERLYEMIRSLRSDEQAGRSTE